jgi:hypothetical protein
MFAKFRPIVCFSFRDVVGFKREGLAPSRHTEGEALLFGTMLTAHMMVGQYRMIV